jgi:hypothetical protein
MNTKWFGMAVVLAWVAAACGEGHLIFNVDVYSFLQGSLKDTVSYAAPPLPGTYTAPDPGAQKITLVPGLGSSAIDTVKVTVAADVINQSGGPGTLRFQAYLASDSAGTYTASKDSLFNPAPTANLTAGVNTQPISFSGVLSPSGNALFTKSAIWVRLAATASNSGAVFMQGKAALTGLNLRVVVQDKFIQ